MTEQTTVGEALIKLLHQHGVTTVFGIPGVHTVPMYRGLADGPITHVTPRHEQGAAFMADGWSRVSGEPGVCFLITGPGLSNAATAIAQAYSDSVPMLVISSVNPARKPEKGEGRLHELPDQAAFAATITASTHTLTEAQELPALLAKIFAGLRTERPRPIHLQIATDMLERACPPMQSLTPPSSLPAPDERALSSAVELIRAAVRPLLIVGGGCADAQQQVTAFAERLDAPVITTLAAKGVIADSHSLCVGARLGSDHVREAIAQADLAVVVGSELAPTDLWPHESLVLPQRLIRIDIDPRQFEFEPDCDVALIGDSVHCLEQLLDRLQPDRTNASATASAGARRCARLRDGVPDDENFQRWLTPLREVLARDAIICADSTQVVYAAGASFPMYQPRGWLTSVTGFGTLGYALPAAIGAALNLRSRADARRVLCLIGDGGLQFTMAELMTASQLGVGIDIVVWNNAGYGEIRDSMLARGVRPEGVDVAAPDLLLLAQACAVSATRVDSPEQLCQVLAEPASGPRLIDVTLV